MEGKDKLTETYMPDKSAQKGRVVVGLSGGIDSMVTAYLLKIQRYELIGVTIAPSLDDYSKDQSALLSCSVSDKKIEALAAFCHQLGIPHYVVRVPGEFREAVLERWVTRKASGDVPDQCWFCHSLRMEFLHAKMKELGAKILATGHFAKIFRQEAQSMTFIQTSSDQANDQSALLSRLPPEVLKDLMLPLSDLHKKEVLKLAENFGLVSTDKQIAPFQCFPDNEDTIHYLELRLPQRFRKEGTIVSGTDERLLEHEGVHKFRRGAEVMQTSGRVPLYFSRYATAERKIILDPESWFQRTRIVLRSCQIPPETPWSHPFRGVLVREGVHYEAWFYPKALSSCVVETDVPVHILEGETLNVLNKKGKNSRVLLSGVANFIEEEKIEGEINVKVDYSREF
jgi:tRNA U34 2-thiouridine synthase MnmA/TrmU